MAQLKFYRKNVAPSSPVAGAIWFNTDDKTIQIYTGSAWEKYAGNLNNATWANNTLTITKHDGSSIALDFSDMASATVMGKMLAAVGLNTDGTFKNNTTNYGTDAKSIGGEIAAIDTKLKSVSDLVGTDSVSKQVGDAKTELIGQTTNTANVDTIKGAKAYAAQAAGSAEVTAKKYTDAELKALTDTVSSAADEKVVVSVKQTNGKVETVSVSLSDIASAEELANVKKTAEDAQTASEVSTAISTAISGLDADITGSTSDGRITVEVVEADGKITEVKVSDNNIASANTLKEVKDKVDAFFKDADIAEVADKYKDTLKELQTYITEDAAAAATMAGNIAANKTEVRTLATSTVNGHAIGTVVEDKIVAQTIVLNGSEIKLDGYVKNFSANASIAAADTINAALGKLEAKADKALSDASNAAAAGVTSLNGKTGAIIIATGKLPGTINVGENAIAVNGLGSAAYTASTAYATAAQGTKADSAYQKPSTGIPATDLATTVQTSLDKADAAAPQATTYTKAEVDAMFTWAEF